MDREVWRAAVHGVAKNRTRLMTELNWTVHQSRLSGTLNLYPLDSSRNPTLSYTKPNWTTMTPNIVWHPLYGDLQMNSQNRDSQTSRTNYGCWGEDCWSGVGIVRELGMDTHILLYSKWMTHKDLLHSTWNSVQCYVEVGIGGAFGGENGYMYTHGWVPLLFTWSYHNVLNGLYPNTK